MLALNLGVELGAEDADLIARLEPAEAEPEDHQRGEGNKN